MIIVTARQADASDTGGRANAGTVSESELPRACASNAAKAFLQVSHMMGNILQEASGKPSQTDGIG